MNASQRRAHILDYLRAAQAPLSATALAQRLSVSRQIIVGDVALLRAAGADISATPRGYVILKAAGGFVRQVACRHDAAGMEAELNAVVDQGCTVVNVIVEHPVYGQLTGPLDLSSRYDILEFIRKVEENAARPLSALTDGIHLHTLRCPDERAFERAAAALAAEGFLVK